MEFTISKDSIKSKVFFNYDSLETKFDNITNTLGTIQLNISEGKIEMSSQNSQYILKTIVRDSAIKVEKGYICNISGSNFYNALSSIRGDSVTFKFDIEGSKLTIKSGRQKYDLVYKLNSSFADVWKVNVDKEIDGNFLNYIIKNTEFCLSKDKIMPIMGCIWFGETYSIGGDGKRFTAIKLSEEFPIRDIAVPAKILGVASDVYNTNKNQKMFFSYNGSEQVYFKIGDDFFIVGTLISQRYPKEIGNHIKKYEASMTCKTSEFFEIVQNYSSLLSDEFNILNLDIKDGKVYLSINTNGCNAEDYVEIESKSDDIKDGVSLKCNYKFMLDILKHINKDNETFGLQIADNKNICNIITKDENFIHPMCLIVSN